MAAGTDEDEAWMEAEMERELQSMSLPDSEEDEEDLTPNDLAEDNNVEVSFMDYLTM